MTNIKNEEIKPTTAMIITTIITVIVLVVVFQVFWYNPLKEKLNTAKKHINECENIIIDLRSLLAKEKVDFARFKLEAAKNTNGMIEKIKELTQKTSRLSAYIYEIYDPWNSFEGNFCTDKHLIPNTLKWVGRVKAEVQK